MSSSCLRTIKMAVLSQKMRMDWDRRSRENAFHYVNTERIDWDESEFFATGERNVRDQILSDMESICANRDSRSMRALEIGCGVGRMTRALSDIFGEVHGVDVSRKMVKQARRYLRGRPNVHVHRNSGFDLRVLRDLQFDFAFSFIVFQHIPSKAIIDNYVAEVGRRLVPGGLFKFQVQGYESIAPSGLRADTWLGAAVSEHYAAGMAARNGFEIEHSTGAGTQYYWLWFRKL